MLISEESFENELIGNSQRIRVFLIIKDEWGLGWGLALPSWRKGISGLVEQLGDGIFMGLVI